MLIQLLDLLKRSHRFHAPIITTNDCEEAAELLTVTSLDLQKLPQTADQKVDFKFTIICRLHYSSMSTVVVIITHNQLRNWWLAQRTKKISLNLPFKGGL